MRRPNRSAVVRFAVAGSVLVLVLAAAGALIVPRLVEFDRLREELVTQLSAKLGATVELAALRVSLVPLPHVVLEQLRLSVAPTLDATIESVAVYPRLRALLTGRLQLSQVAVSRARVQIQLPHEPAGEPAGGTERTMQGLRDTVAAGLASVTSVAAAYAPGLVLHLTNSTASVAAANGQVFAFTDLHGGVRLPPDTLRIDLACRSNLWEQATLNAAIDPASIHGDGRLTLNGLRSQALGRYLLPAGMEIEDAPATVDVHVSAAGLDVLHADAEVAVPTLGLQRGDQHLALADMRIKASGKVDGQTAGVTLDDVRLAVPPLQLSGSLVLDHATPPVRLELEGKDLDVAAAHEAAIFFAATNPTTRAIFTILRAGHVPQLTVQAQGQTLGDLGSLEAIVIRGALVDGQVHIPGAEIDLADVGGGVSVVNGVLAGEHAAGRLGNTHATDGSVRIGLAGESRELSVKTAVQADARDVPALLRQIVANETLNRVLDRLTDVQGSAGGQLTLSGSTDAVTVAMDVSELKVSARDRDMRQPLRIESGTFHYDARDIAATDLKVASGDSWVAQLSGRVDMSATPPSLDVSGADGHLALAEIYPWVAAMGWLPDSAWTPNAVTGTAGIESVRVRGPAARPDRWRIELAGTAQNLDLDAPRLRQAVAVRFPLSLADLHLTHEPGASALATRAVTADGLSGTVDMEWDAAELNVKRASIRDAESNASGSLLLKGRQFDVTFAGNVEAATLEALLPSEHHISKSLRGDLRAHILMDRPTDSTAEGHLEVDHVAFPAFGHQKLEVERANLKANTGLLGIEAEADVEPGAPMHLHLHGALRPGPDAFIADLDLSAGQVDWARLEALRPPTVPDGETGETPASPLPLRGKLRVTAESFTYGAYTWQPVRAVVDFAQGTPSITVTQATLCGIGTTGMINETPGGLSLGFNAVAKHQEVDQTAICLLGKSLRMSGQCSLNARGDASGRGSELVTSASGNVHFTATKGRIYQGGVIEKILAVMSIGYGSWNILADLTDDGLPYNTIDVKGELREGTLVLTEATMDAPSMKMVAEGRIDVSRGTIDVTLLAAPLKTMDTVVSRIPIVGYVLGGNLVTIPIKVSGALDDPEVKTLSASEVGSGLLRVMTRVVKLPLRALQLVSPADRNP